LRFIIKGNRRRRVKVSFVREVLLELAGGGQFRRQTMRRVAFSLRVKGIRAEEWKQWLAENGGRLLLFARGWSNTREDAEDLVQEAILRLWHNQKEKGDGPPDLPLVFSTIRFCGLSHHRSEKRRRKREDSVVYLNDFQDVWLDPMMEDDEDADVLRDAVQGLSQKLREVVVMKTWGGLTFLQISEALAISPNTAASRYRYALEQLSHALRRVKEDRHESA
jgi:RNA polymerase sigma-70 factor, ECF subfamily